jgi:hypothetical protein
MQSYRKAMTRMHSLAMICGLILAATSTGRAADYFTLPKIVQATVDVWCPGARLTDVEITNVNGYQLYEIQVRHRRLERNLTIAKDGSLISRQIAWEELPGPVQKTARNEIGDRKLAEIYWTNEEGIPAYYLEHTPGPNVSSIIIAPDGWVISRQIRVQEATPAVQQAIRDKLPGHVPASVYQSTEEEEVFYEVTDVLQANERFWLFHTNGAVAAESIEFSAMPEAARKVLIQQVARDRIVRLLTYADQAGAYYEAAFVRNDARHVCTVNEQGVILSEELPLTAVPEPVRKLITAQTAGGYVARIERAPGPGGIAYEVLWRREGHEFTITINPPPDK